MNCWIMAISISIKITTSQCHIVSGKQCDESQRTDGLLLNNDDDSLHQSRCSEPHVKEYINGPKPQVAKLAGQNQKKSTEKSTKNVITGTPLTH